MQKTLLFIFALLFTLQTGTAQLTITATTVDETLDVGIQKEMMAVYITNTSTTDAVTVQWNRIENMPEGWQSFVCDKELCYLPTADTGTFSLDPEEEAFMKVTATAMSEGSGTVTIDMFDTANAEDAVQTVFNMNAVLTDVDDIDVENIRIYPNPASDYIKISNPEGIESMELYNLIGKKVRSFNVGSSNSTFNISNLPKGMYLIRLLDDDNDVLTTKRISKR